MLATMYSCHIPGRRTNSTSACETYKIFPAVLCSYGYENSVVFFLQHHLLVRLALEH